MCSVNFSSTYPIPGWICRSQHVLFFPSQHNLWILRALLWMSNCHQGGSVPPALSNINKREILAYLPNLRQNPLRHHPDIPKNKHRNCSENPWQWTNIELRILLTVTPLVLFLGWHGNGRTSHRSLLLFPKMTSMSTSQKNLKTKTWWGLSKKIGRSRDEGILCLTFTVGFLFDYLFRMRLLKLDASGLMREGVFPSFHGIWESSKTVIIKKKLAETRE